MVNAGDEAVRKEFEAWARQSGKGGLARIVCWAAWQAARSAAIQECADATHCYMCQVEIEALKER